MKSFDDFLEEFNQSKRTSTIESVMSNMNLSNVEEFVTVLASGIALIDKRAEDRLRAYHEWMSKDS